MINDAAYGSKYSLFSEYDYEEYGELRWKADDRISVRRFLSLAEMYQKELSVSDMCVISIINVYNLQFVSLIIILN